MTSVVRSCCGKTLVCVFVQCGSNKRILLHAVVEKKIFFNVIDSTVLDAVTVLHVK